MLLNPSTSRAFVTGAASGIGLGIALALAEAGLAVAMADVDIDGLRAAEGAVRAKGVQTFSVQVDVSDEPAMIHAASRVRAEFGGIHILVNNAGVAYNAAPLWQAQREMIDWSFAVNVGGVINGVRAFVPGMIADGEGGHIVNTASIGGFQVRSSPSWHQGLYAATKFAVVALSEGLRQDLAEHRIGVSVLAPASVATRIGTSDRNRPVRFGGPTTGSQRPAVLEMLASQGMSPLTVGHMVVEAIWHNDLYIFTHPQERAVVAARHASIMAGFDLADQRAQLSLP
jgi:NAD(P)-dependent dehydrogenase (short-subunit alcohol dehydrogenase family)